MSAEPFEQHDPVPHHAEPMPHVAGYRLLRVLGHGGMSTVYLAEQESLGREVAIKVMLPEALADEVSRRRFENEARTVARLEHPHIVGIFEVGRTDAGLPYYAMPYLARGHLGQHSFFENQADDAAEETRVIAILRALLAALDYAHARGVVHRDVKAENVLFDDAQRALLADFGIALRKGNSPRVTTAGLAVGSTAYMAPEQARGEEVDGRADLYAVGVLAWEMLTGDLPYAAGDALSMAVMHAQDPIPRLPARHRHWQRFIEKALAKSPSQRFRNATQMLEALQRLERRRPIPGWAAMSRLGTQIGRPHRWPRPVQGALLLLAAAGVGVWLQLGERGDADFLRAGGGAPLAGVTAAPLAAPADTAAPADAQSPTQRWLDAAATQIEARNLTRPEGDNAHDSVLAAWDADPAHPQMAATVDALIAALGVEIQRHLEAGNQGRANDYLERAATLAERTGREDSQAMGTLRQDALAALAARVEQAASRFDRNGAQQLAALATRYGADATAVARLQARANAIPQAGDRVPDDPTGAVLVRGPGGMFAASRSEVSRSDYARFAAATRRPAALCRERMSPLRIVAPRSWRAPGFEQNESQPVVCVSWSDADAYARWLSARSGVRYNLPDAAQWQALAGPANGSRRAVAEWLRTCSQGCRERLVAGSSWRGAKDSEPREAARGFDDVGFRLVREL